MSDVVSLAAELLAGPSPSRDEGRAVEFVSRWLIARGWNVTLQEVSPGRSNVWASRRGGGVTLSTHLDTVPPYVPPRLDAERLHGRGACDAKGIAAAMLVAAGRLAEAGGGREDRPFGARGPVRAALEGGAGDGAELAFGSFIPPQRFHVVPGFETAPMAYTSDIPLLPRWGTPLLFGPGSIHVAHTPDEFIVLDELRGSVDAYERLVRSLLAS